MLRKVLQVRWVAEIGMMLIAMVGLTTIIASAQTYSVLYNFNGGADGANPNAGVTLDPAGNLYGTAARGGSLAGDCSTLGSWGGVNTHGCGTVFQLKRHNPGWILNPLYTFQLTDGALPLARVVFGPGGLLYGTTSLGGALTDCRNNNWIGCGVIFALQPPATACKSALCPWNQAKLQLVGTQGDGFWSCRGDLIFDPSGNAYTANIGGVYQLTPSGNGWKATELYNLLPSSGFYFQNPAGCVVLDSAGNLYGTGQSGPGAPGDGNGGGVYELTPSSPPWQLSYLYINTLGGATQAGVVRDSAGNLYGSTNAGGQYGGGTVFEASPSNGGWTSTILYNFSGSLGPYADMVLDADGNLYGTTVADGPYGHGNVFKLTPSNGQWIYTSLHDFTGGADGGAPYGQVTLDASGNLYGTATVGGANNKGVVWEMTP